MGLITIGWEWEWDVGLHCRQTFGAPSVFTLGGASDDTAHEWFYTANSNRANLLLDAIRSVSKLPRNMRYCLPHHVTISGETADDGDTTLAAGALAAVC